MTIEQRLDQIDQQQKILIAMLSKLLPVSNEVNKYASKIKLSCAPRKTKRKITQKQEV